MIPKGYQKSKTTAPQVFHKLLPRKNVAAVIDNTTLEEVVYLFAPYGCGKTLSVLSWLKEGGRNAAWLTLDETDNSEEAFFTGVTEAIMRFSGWNGGTDEILSDPGYAKSHQEFLWEAITFVEKESHDKILVIDCFRFIRDQELLRAIKEFVSMLLGRWRVIIIGRAEPPAVFNDLLLRRRMCLISLKELSFSPEEISEFFVMNGCAVSRQNIARIKKETEGWPASLNVILILSRGGTAGYSEAARAYLMDFFETEIWRELDEEVKDFLLKTSVLDRLTPASCNAVTDMGATLPTLRRLFVNGLFLSRHDERDTYRYHRVFKDFLLDKLASSGIDKRKLYKKIAWRLFEKDEYEQAFPYFFKAGDLYGLSRVLRNINSTDMGIERYLELTGCVTSLDIEELRDYPLIAARIALIHFALGNIDEMQRFYEVLIEWVQPGELQLPPEEYAECVWEVGWLSYLNPAEYIENNPRHSEWINSAEYDTHLKELQNIRAAVYRFPSVLRGLRDYCPALRGIEEFARLNKETDREMIDSKTALWQIEIIRAEYAYEQENFGLAEELIRGVISEIEEDKVTDLYFACIAVLVKIVRAAHDPKEIGVLTSHVETMIRKNKHLFLLPGFHAFELRNRLADGIDGQTEVFEKENRAYVEKPYFYLLYRHITLVRALLSTGDYNEAIMILGNLENICRQYDRIMDRIEVRILRAVADFGLGNEDGACRELNEAINAAAEYGFIRIFSDDAKALWPILEVLSKQRNDAYFKNIVISCKKTLARAGIKLYNKNHKNFELTKTELKILKTLNTEMSYDEIALDNNIKLSTVKSHIHSIYSKLGVDSRGSAVMTAQNMGIIEQIER